MAVGGSFPAAFKDDSGETRIYGNVEFQDSANQPGSALLAVTSGAALPTADPHVVGRLWANSGVVTVSAG